MSADSPERYASHLSNECKIAANELSVPEIYAKPSRYVRTSSCFHLPHHGKTTAHPIDSRTGSETNGRLDLPYTSSTKANGAVSGKIQAQHRPSPGTRYEETHRKSAISRQPLGRFGHDHFHLKATTWGTQDTKSPRNRITRCGDITSRTPGGTPKSGTNFKRL